MRLYEIGSTLLYFREKNKLSQSQVCEGICTEMTVSRIEMGERGFDFLLLSTLLERIGKTVQRFEFVLNENDYKLCELRYRLEKGIEEKDIEKVKHYLERYQENMPKNQVLHKQFLLFNKAMYMQLIGCADEEIILCLCEAISLTRPAFQQSSMKLCLYSVIEIKILYQLFLYNKYDEQMLESVFRFMEELYDEEEQRKLMIPFLYQLILRSEKKENYYEMNAIADKAIAILQRGRTYTYLVEFYFLKLKASEALYVNSVGWKEHRIELIKLCNELYYMAMINEDADMMTQTIDFCEERLGCQIIT